MQNRLYIEEADTALDIFSFAVFFHEMSSLQPQNNKHTLRFMDIEVGQGTRVFLLKMEPFNKYYIDKAHVALDILFHFKLRNLELILNTGNGIIHTGKGIISQIFRSRIQQLL